MMNKIIVLVLCLLSSLAFGVVEKKEFYEKGINLLVVKNTSGNTSITVSDDNKAYVVAKKIKFEKNCHLDISRSGNTLSIVVRNDGGVSGWFAGNACEVDFDVKVPRVIDLDLRSGSGRMNVDGTKGKIELRLGSGGAKIYADVEKFKGRAGSGHFEVNGMLGSGDVQLGSGGVAMIYKTKPKKGSLDIRMGSGDAEIFFPVGMEILTKFNAGSGSIYNELGDSNKAHFKVTVKAGSGNLRIKKLK